MTNGIATTDLLHYRPWRGTFHDSWSAVWAIARIGLGQLFRRRIFWVLYGLGLIVFMLFFFGQYLLAWAETQPADEMVRVGGFGRARPRELINVLRVFLKLDGSGETFKNFLGYQGYTVMVVLALAGAVLIGNDLRFGGLTFYLSKPLGRWHYLFGKALAVAVFINMMTTLPALALFVQFGLLDSWAYFRDRAYLFWGILAYGAVLTVSLTLVLLATATWLRRTAPLVLAWTSLFFFFRLLAAALVEGLRFDEHWWLIDLWNNTYLVGLACLRLPPVPRQPAWPWAALVLALVSCACLMYLSLRLRAVEVVK